MRQNPIFPLWNVLRSLRGIRLAHPSFRALFQSEKNPMKIHSAKH